MARRLYDPLEQLPSATAIRAKLLDTEKLAAKLKILLDLVQRLEAPISSGVPSFGQSAGGTAPEGDRP